MSRVQIPSIAPFYPPMRHLVSWLQALLLGVVQGITEFFPVSSSAHLKIFKKILAISDGEHLLYFDLMCHAGTLLALIFFLRKEIFHTLASWRQMALFATALIPLVPAYFLLKPLRIAASDPSLLGVFLMATGGLLLLAHRQERVAVLAAGPQQPVRLKQAFLIGSMQAAALIPGLSRSGSTIALGRLLGFSWTQAARFSFLLAVPTILGGEMLETWKWLQHRPDASYAALGWEIYAVGFAAAFGIGLLAVRFVFWVYERKAVAPIAWYCIGMGLMALAIFNG